MISFRNTLLLRLFALVFTLSVSCKKTSKEESKVSEITNVDVRVNISEYENAGRCAILESVLNRNYTPQLAKAHSAAAAQRVRTAELIWTKVAAERVQRGTDFGFNWTNRLQTRGYIEPMFLADIKVPLKFSGSNHWDYYEYMTVAAKNYATALARKLSLKTKSKLRIGEIVEAAMNETSGDPYKAFGLLGALTIWDRWNAEALSSKNGGHRNQYTVLPGLFASIGEGDATGQTYHFWGFVAHVIANGPEMGLAMGQATTVGYEVVRNWMSGKRADMEDFDIDNRAMGFAVGAYSILSAVPTLTVAKELHKKYLCQFRPAQFETSAEAFSRSCEIWLGTAASKDEAVSQIPALIAKKPSSFLHFDELFRCSVRAKQAPEQYK